MKRILLYTGIFLLTGLLAISAKMTIDLSQTDIIFSHQFHIEEMETGCIACHIDIESSESATDDNLPTMDECSACHDVEDDTNCGMCHKNTDEPGAAVHVEHTYNFNHAKHLAQGLTCERCHTAVINSEEPVNNAFPVKKDCMGCHNNQTASSECSLCHTDGMTLATIHPADWRHSHGQQVKFDDEFCQACHQMPDFCIKCHMGDNLLGNVHDLNFQFTHGLEAQAKQADCAVCHSQQAFCTTCHESGNRMPLAHSASYWIARHGRVAKNDPENCAVCHDTADPTCANGGCHNDFDGVRGTNPKIHRDDAYIFESKGDWHDDDNAFCYQCHLNSAQTGFGYCNYCHGNKNN